MCDGLGTQLRKQRILAQGSLGYAGATCSKKRRILPFASSDAAYDIVVFLMMPIWIVMLGTAKS